MMVLHAPGLMLPVLRMQFYAVMVSVRCAYTAQTFHVLIELVHVALLCFTCIHGLVLGVTFAML